LASSKQAHLRPGARLVKNAARRRLLFDLLESRDLLCGDVCEIELLPVLDQFGEQIVAVMGYKSPGESDAQARITTGIYDTGASVATIAHSDQALLELLETPIPIKVPGGAEADAIGGVLTGDVSEPGEFIADGLHAWSFTADVFEQGIILDASSARADGIQAFVGTESGSPALPSIVGTVIHNPSAAHPNGLASWIDMTAFQFDFGELFPEFPEFQGIVLNMPDLRFVEPNTELTAATDGSETAVMRIPLELWGDNNYDNPGDSITYSPNPVQTNVSYALGGASVSGKTALFDTGAQLSVISTEVALSLGLNLDLPETTITVQGAGGTAEIPGFTIDTLELPRDDNSDGVIDGTLRFTNVPIYVLDVVPGLDGIIGMNLFNTAKGLLYDPYDAAGASLQVNFFNDLIREIPVEGSEDEQALDVLGAAFPAFGQQYAIPSFGIGVGVPLPNEAPTEVSLTRTSVFNGIAGAWIGSVTASDPNPGDTHTFAVSDSRFEVRSGQLYLKAQESLSLASGATIDLTITATDAGGLSLERPFTLNVVNGPATWEFAHQWAPAPVDVNADGDISALDAVLISNLINAFGPFTYDAGEVGGTASGPFYDATGDNSVDPFDFVVVSNFINAGGAGSAGEGEAVVAPMATRASSSVGESTTREEVAQPLALLPVASTAAASATTEVHNDSLWLAAWNAIEREPTVYGPQLPRESRLNESFGASDTAGKDSLWSLLWGDVE
jgi:hypothetical protein